MSAAPKLVLLGYGQLGMAVHLEALSRGTAGAILATTRSAAHADEMMATYGVNTLLLSSPEAAPAVTAATEILRGAARAGDDVIVSCPPDGTSDASYAPVLRAARRIVYISSTGVFGSASGHIDDTTAVDPSDARAARRLAAEDAWRDVGAIVLRAPAIYGPRSGLHKRLLAGTYRLVEDGARHVSRIHVDDLAVLALAALERAAPGSTYVVGDHGPATQRQVTEWLCARLGLALPPSASEGDAPSPFRGDRRIDGGRALRELGVTLRYATYREGYEAVLRAGGYV